jgi:subtilase family serine protease
VPAVSRAARFLSILTSLILISQSMLAQSQGFRMPFPGRGLFRPPFWARPDVTPAALPSGKSPANARHAYAFDQLANQGAGQTIAIVDAYDDPNIQADLNTFDTTYGLPACNSSNGCFRKIYATGRKPLTNSGWALEISLDVEWAHAIAPQAKIILVEASSSTISALMRAVDVAVGNGASVVSMSFGGGEFSAEASNDAAHFSYNGVTFTASSGDSGTGAEYPAASPDVIAVGGTTLNTNSSGAYVSETAWSGSGGGLSAVENEPGYQSSYPIPNDTTGKRGIPDVAYDADPNTGFAVYDSLSYQGHSGWWVVGGTSAGAPQWAALFAIANSLRVAAGKGTLNSTGTPLYAVAKSAYSTNFHDVTGGTNGSCGSRCSARSGYDYVTGLGSPKAQAIVPALVKRP